MEFSFLYSVVIPIIVSASTGLVAYYFGGRKQKNDFYNATIDKIETMLDEAYNVAKDVFPKEYSDGDYYFMVYQYDNLHTELSKLNKEIGVFELSTLKRILTDYIFYKKEKATMESLSRQINIIKQNLRKKHW